MNIQKCKIVIYNYTQDEYFWELRDPQGHPICRCAPRNGQGFYTTEYSCLRSAKRFRSLLGVRNGCQIIKHYGSCQIIKHYGKCGV